jgi:ribosome-associated translation inhibitor RaiA
MHVLVNPDHHITGDEWVTARVEGIVENAVDRFADRITRVEVHLNDVNGPKHGLREKRCLMEARVGGVKPIAVKHQAPSLLEAIEGAADKLERAVDHALARLQASAGRSPRDVEIASIEALQELQQMEASRH